MLPIYLDYNATTPIDPLVIKAMMPYITDHFGNPSSSHIYGQIAADAVSTARRQIAGLLECSPEEILFTSGGSESNNLAITGIARSLKSKGRHIITSSIEHPAVLQVCKALESEGFEVDYLTVDQFGMINPSMIESAIKPDTILISIMHANNEVGTIQPIREIAEIAHSHGAVMHSDCAQSLGKIKCTPGDLGADLISVAGHKLYAPKGIGALYIKNGLFPDRLIHGAEHESGRRAGTENVSQIVGLGKACEQIISSLVDEEDKLSTLRDELESAIMDLPVETIINGHPEKRLPNTTSISFKNCTADLILKKMPGIAASAGAACHSDTVKISSVLEAMNVSDEFAAGTIRFSVGRFTTDDQIKDCIDQLQAVFSNTDNLLQ